MVYASMPYITLIGIYCGPSRVKTIAKFTNFSSMGTLPPVRAKLGAREWAQNVLYHAKVWGSGDYLGLQSYLWTG